MNAIESANSRFDAARVRLRPVTPADFPVLYGFQCDPESNRMAVTKPRRPEAFAKIMADALSNPLVVARVIVTPVGPIDAHETTADCARGTRTQAGVPGEAEARLRREAAGSEVGRAGRVEWVAAGEMILGSISCFQMDGVDAVGYWISREHWGKGIAKRAVGLLLEEVKRRPLHARAAATNAASIKVLLGNGFRATGTFSEAETERFPACEVVAFVLD